MIIIKDTREEVPTLDSDLERKLERRLKPGRWSPWGMEVLWREGWKIHQHQDCDLKQIAFSETAYSIGKKPLICWP